MSDALFFGFIILLVVLCAGTPDLIDAMVAYVMSQSKVCP